MKNYSVLTDETFGQRIKELAEIYGDKPALIDEEREVSYKQLNTDAKKIALHLYRLGLRAGDHVVLHLTNSVRAVEILFGIFKLGLLPVMGLPAHGKNDLDGIFKKVRPAAYFVGESYMGRSYQELADYFKSKYPSVKNVITTGNLKNALGIEEILNRAYDPTDKEIREIGGNISASDIALILLSGGTTGTPKLIPRTHADYLYNCRCAAKRCAVDENERYLCALPFSHNFSLSSFGIFGVLENGGSVFMCGMPDAGEILDSIEAYEITSLALVPAILSMCLDILEWDDDYDLDSLRLILVGGAVFEKKDGERMRDLMPGRLEQVFGTAEGLICMSRLDDTYDTILNTQGVPISPYDDLRFVDENLKDVKEGEPGELITKGPYTIEAYYMADPGVNESSFTSDGFYRTGDKAYLTADGNLVVIGRAKEQINKGGEKIMPSEVEEILCKFPAIREAAVVGVDDKALGQKVVAFVVTDKEVGLEEVRAFFKSLDVAVYKWPDKLVVLDAFPLTKVGKVDKKELAKIGGNEGGV